MFELIHYDDKKEKFQSHEITIGGEIGIKPDIGLYSGDFSDITGYGSTKDEAINDFIRKYEYLINQYNAFLNMIHANAIDIKEK